ncbi:MAG: 50S ribosomal protein L31e [Candidatus Pacearchaeota archaeon]|nr:50S ribosomal protein L31e [Candidatus Pacearchaeota archaeon]
MAEKEKKAEKVLERTYVIPLRRGWLKAPQHRRAKKAVRLVKEFLAKHMKVEDRNLSKVKLDSWLNKALWSRGIKSPPHKITVKATKDSNGIVYAEFIGLPKNFKAEDAFFKKKMEKEAKRKTAVKEKKETKKEEKKEKKTEEELLKEKEEKEKEKALHNEVQKHEVKTDHLKGGKVERQHVHKMQTGK